AASFLAERSEHCLVGLDGDATSECGHHEPTKISDFHRQSLSLYGGPVRQPPFGRLIRPCAYGSNALGPKMRRAARSAAPVFHPVSQAYSGYGFSVSIL